MLVSVGGLTKLEPPEYYRLWLQRGSKTTLPCGDFVVEGGNKRTVVRFTVSYSIKPGDRWIVTKQAAGQHRTPGQLLLTT